MEIALACVADIEDQGKERTERFLDEVRLPA